MKKILFLLFLFFGVFFFQTDLSFAGDDITKPDFMIDVNTISPGGESLVDPDGDGRVTVNNVLTTVLNKLVVVFWVIAVFIMTIGAGYMIIYHGQDEFLSKGKSIFMSGIIALVIALSAGVIVNLFKYLLY